jgi:hypothetical protein
LNSNLSDTGETLAKAADYIDEHGHHKGAFYHRGAVCARGAINAVLYDDADECGEFEGEATMVAQALADHIGIVSTLDTGSETFVVPAIARWNDAPERTAAEVMAAMRECAAELAGTAK